MPYIPLASKSGALSSNPELNTSPERMVNYVPVPGDGFGKVHALRRYGLVERQATDNEVDAIVTNGSDLYFISDGRLWQQDGTPTDLGFVGYGEVVMAASESEVAIVVDNKYFLWDGSTLTQHTAGAVTYPKGVCFVDGFFVVWGGGVAGPDGFQISYLNDGSTFNGSDLLSATSKADPIRCIVPVPTGIAVVGSSTIEFWRNAGATTGLFRKAKGTTLGFGARNRSLVCEDEGVIFLVGNDNRVYRVAGYGYEVISSEAGNEVTENMNASFACRQRGGRFICFRRGDGRPTVVFNTSTGLWSEFSTNDGAWEPVCATEYFNRQYYGSQTGIVENSKSSFDDTTGSAHLCAITPAFDFEGPTTILPNMRLQFGVNTTDIGREPKVMVRISRDGATWGAWKERGLGELGEYNKQVRLRNLGRGRRVQFEVRVTDPVRADLLGVSYG